MYVSLLCICTITVSLWSYINLHYKSAVCKNCIYYFYWPKVQLIVGTFAFAFTMMIGYWWLTVDFGFHLLKFLWSNVLQFQDDALVCHIVIFMSQINNNDNNINNNNNNNTTNNNNNNNVSKVIWQRAASPTSPRGCKGILQS